MCLAIDEADICLTCKTKMRLALSGLAHRLKIRWQRYKEKMNYQRKLAFIFLAFGDSSPSVGLSPWWWAVARAVAVRWLQAHKEVSRSLVGVVSVLLGSSGCIWYHSALTRG